MMMAFVWNPLGQKSPETSEGYTDDDLDGSMKDELPERSAGAESDSKEDSEAADGDDIVSSAGRDDEGGDAFLQPVAAAGETHERRDDDGGGHCGQDEAQHEADSPG